MLSIPDNLHLLIDADSALYKAGCANETREYLCILDGQVIDSFPYKKDALLLQEETGCEIEAHKTAGPIKYSLANLRSIVDNKMLALPHKSYEMFIGGKGNFRFDYFPEYKQTRDPLAKPLHLEQMKKHLMGRYGAEKIDGEEVDDTVSWKQATAIPDTTCIVTIDKDLDNTAGWHWNYQKQALYYITPEQADLNFARQLLTGDMTDGIPGINGMGAKTAAKILPEYCNDWLDIVRRVYLDKGYTVEYMKQQGICLHMRRSPEEIWDLDYDYSR